MFHDCLEDVSLIYSTGAIAEFNNIFDTQIAHRMCYEDENSCDSIGTKNNSISFHIIKKYYNNHYLLYSTY